MINIANQISELSSMVHKNDWMGGCVDGWMNWCMDEWVCGCWGQLLQPNKNSTVIRLHKGQTQSSTFEM